MSLIKTAGRLLTIAILITACAELHAQTTRINSPYTLFGIGNLNNTNVNARSMAMGGIQFGYRSSGMINVGNPASYTGIDTLSFVFEGALVGNMVTIKSIENSESSNSATLGYLSFGFPVTRWWKSSFGLMPYSNVGYSVAEDRTVDQFGRVRYTSDGSGGFNQVYWGNAIQLTKNLSVGVNAAYVFGSIDHGISVTFPDSGYYFSTRTDKSITASDFVFNYGLQYTFFFKNNLDLTLGTAFGNTTKLSTERDYLARSFYGEANDIRFYKDTVSYYKGEEGDIVLPKHFGGGFVFKKKDKWLIGGDVSWQNWQEYSSYGSTDSLSNRLSFALGGQFTPDKYSIFSYLERVTYRFGIRYTNSYLDIRGNQLNEFGISFGLGLPVWKSKSTFNIGCEIGRWGTTADELIQENFIKFTLGISIYENWFIKPKYR